MNILIILLIISAGIWMTALTKLLDTTIDTQARIIETQSMVLDMIEADKARCRTLVLKGLASQQGMKENSLPK